MNKIKYNRILMTVANIDREFGKEFGVFSHRRIHQDMMRLIISLADESYEMQREIKELKEELKALTHENY